MANQAVKDHLGNEFKSYKAMCEYYNLTLHTLHVMQVKGYTLAEILTHQLKDDDMHFLNREYMKLCRKKAVKRIEYLVPIDHNGKRYASVEDMCKQYGIAKSILARRLAYGWDMKQSLECKSGTAHRVHDPFTNELCTKEQLCERYSIQPELLEEVAETMSRNFKKAAYTIIINRDA